MGKRCLLVGLQFTVSRMASKTPPFLLMSPETWLSEAPGRSWTKSKHPQGLRLRAKRFT